MKIEQIVKNLREDADLKQEVVARELQVSQSYYSKQERGEKPFRLEQIRKLCLLYQVSADYILELPEGLSWPR